MKGGFHDNSPTGGLTSLVFVYVYLTQQHKEQKFTLEQAMKAHGGSRGYNSTLTLTSALDGVGGQRHGPAVLSPGITGHPMSVRVN